MVGSFNASGGYQFPTGGFGSYNFGGSGEKGMKTPGEFSHDSNPINLMQNGAKVGEVTGGEYVVNPLKQKRLQSKVLMQECSLRNSIRRRNVNLHK